MTVFLHVVLAHITTLQKTIALIVQSTVLHAMPAMIGLLCFVRAANLLLGLMLLLKHAMVFLCVLSARITI